MIKWLLNFVPAKHIHMTKTSQTVSPLTTIHHKLNKKKQNIKVWTSENYLAVCKLVQENKKFNQKILV